MRHATCTSQRARRPSASHGPWACRAVVLCAAPRELEVGCSEGVGEREVVGQPALRERHGRAGLRALFVRVTVTADRQRSGAGHPGHAHGRYYMLHGFYKKEKVNFGVNLTQFQTLCKDMRLSFPVMNKAPPVITHTPAPRRPTTLLSYCLCVLRPIQFRSVLFPAVSRLPFVRAITRVRCTLARVWSAAGTAAGCIDHLAPAWHGRSRRSSRWRISRRATYTAKWCSAPLKSSSRQTREPPLWPTRLLARLRIGRSPARKRTGYC